MGRALDPEVQRVANMRRRLAMLERHSAARDPESGKSAIAVAGGRIAGQRNIERHGGSSARGLRLALARWHGQHDARRDGRAAQGEVRDAGAQPSA